MRPSCGGFAGEKVGPGPGSGGGFCAKMVVFCDLETVMWENEKRASRRSEKSQSKQRKEPVGGSKPRKGPTKTTVGFDQYYGRAGGAATEVFCRSNEETKRGRQASKCRGGFAAVDFSAAVLLQYASKPLK